MKVPSMSKERDGNATRPWALLTCFTCGSAVSSQEETCDSCGGEQLVEPTVEVMRRIAATSIGESRSRRSWTRQITQGTFRQADGSYANVYRFVDREDNWYEEHVRQ